MIRKKLGVNIDHVATLREIRRTPYPDPVTAAVIVELAGADGITVHLREDRRHIKERDLYILKEVVKTRLNLEMALSDEIIKIALSVKPDEVCIVPERRMELTTEGGLNVIDNLKKLEEVISDFKANGIKVSLFVDPDPEQIKAAKDVCADYIELHTGKYAEATGDKEKNEELQKLSEAAKFASSLGLKVNAGHGLNYQNVSDVVKIEEIETLNIGHSIISYSVFVGLERAVKEMLRLIKHIT